MYNKKRTTEEFDQWLAWDQDTYQTGSTRPPKSHGGLIAFLLGLVIFLCGISTALGLMNIKLFQQLTAAEAETASSIAFAYSAEDPTQYDEAAVPFALGFSGQTVPDFWNLYQDIPQGFYITDVLKDSEAAKRGMIPGDIILQVDGIRITDSDGLSSLLDQYQSQSSVRITLFRDQQEMIITLRID